MFVGGSDALKATTYFTSPHRYAQHRNFTEDLPKIKHKLIYKGAIRLVWVCWLFFFIWREESALSLNVTGKAKRFRALTECGKANHRNFFEHIRGRKLAREAGSLIDDQGVTGALKEDKAVAGKRDEFALLFAAVEAGAGSVLELLFRRYAFEEQFHVKEPRAGPAGTGSQGRDCARALTARAPLFGLTGLSSRGALPKCPLVLGLNYRRSRQYQFQSRCSIEVD